MSQTLYEKNRYLLKELMQQAGITDSEELCRVAEISDLQLIRIEYGLLRKMSVETSIKLAKALKVSVERIIESFTEVELPEKNSDRDSDIETLKQEYQRLQQQTERQQATLEQEFQQASLAILESWLLQWPTAAAAIAKNPQLPAERLLPLVKPVEQLLEKWGVEAIASVGDELAYDPQQHQLMKGTAEPGDKVQVRYVGYKQGDNLLHRVKVSPLES